MFDLVVNGAIPIAIIAMVVLAILKNAYWFRLSSIIVLVVIVILRECNVYTHSRSLIWEHRSAMTGSSKEGFADGARAVADYCGDTSIVVYLVLAALVVICARGFRQPKAK